MLAMLRADIEGQRSRRTAPALGAGAATMEMLRDVGYVGDPDEVGEDED